MPLPCVELWLGDTTCGKDANCIINNNTLSWHYIYIHKPHAFTCELTPALSFPSALIVTLRPLMRNSKDCRVVTNPHLLHKTNLPANSYLMAGVSQRRCHHPDEQSLGGGGGGGRGRGTTTIPMSNFVSICMLTNPPLPHTSSTWKSPKIKSRRPPPPPPFIDTKRMLSD